MRAHGIAFRAADESGGDGTAATVLVAIDVAFILNAMRVIGGHGSTPGGCRRMVPNQGWRPRPSLGFPRPNPV